MLQIGQHVIYGGRVHVLVGITPISVRPFEMQLEDPETGRVFWIAGQARQREDGLYEVLKGAALNALKNERDRE